jgi:hypothetical protein
VGVERMAKSAGQKLLRMALSWLKNVLLILLGLVPAVVVGDSRGHVGAPGQEKFWSVAAQWSSAVLWVSLFPYIIWESRALNPAFAWGLLVLVPAWFWFGRRVSAARGREMTVWQFVAKVRVALGQAWARVSLISGFTVVVAGIALGLLPHWPAGVEAAQGAFDEILPRYALVVLIGYGITLPLAARAGHLSAVDDLDSANFQAYWASQLSGILSISTREWELAGGKVTLEPGNVIRAEDLPPVARTRFAGIEQRCELIAPGYTVRSHEWDLVLAPIDQEEDVQAARAAKAESGGLISGLRNEPDSLARPLAMTWIVAEGQRFNAGQLDVYARTRGLRVVELREADREVVVASLSPLVQSVRARLANLLNAPEHAIELAITTASGGSIETVEISRYPNMGPDPVRRRETFQQLIGSVPGGSTGWTVTEDAVKGQVTLTYGDPRVLPKLIRGEELLPKTIDASTWARLPLGRNDAGETVSLNLASGPHVAVSGETGSGKTIALRQIMLGALASGFDVVVVDPVKKAAGLKSLAPWTRGIFTKSVPEAAAVLTAVYTEVRRRVDLIDAVDGENWMDLPAGSVKPLLVVIDEFAALAESEGAKPPGIPTDHPIMIEWQEMAFARATIKSTVKKISREARSAGVHLVLSGQQFYAETIDSQTRANLGTVVQLIAPTKPPSKGILSMLFPGDRADDAMAEVEALNDGSKGLGIVFVDGGAVQGIRVGFVDKEDLAAYCELLSVPLGIPLELPEPEPTAGTVSAGPRRNPAPKPAAIPEVVDVGSFSFELDDLKEAPAPLAATPTPQVTSSFDFFFDE